MRKIMPHIHHYASISKWLHWGIGLGIIAMLAFGVYMHEMEDSATKWMYYGWHKSIGIIILALVLVRIIIRFRSHTPPLPLHMKPWQRMASHISHGVLYVLMLYMPLTGWLMSSGGGYDVSVFGSPTLPNLIEKNKELGALFKEMHEVGLWLFVIVITIHASAALLHHFYYKDDVLLRMLPTKPAKKE
jgi:cytochrome b561